MITIQDLVKNFLPQAAEILDNVKKEYSPNGIVNDAKCGGDPYPQQTGESTAAQLGAYTQNLPALLNTTAAQALPVGQTLQTANQSLAPQQQALMNQLLAQYAPDLYNQGNALNQQQLAGGIANASTNLSGQGGQLVNQAIAADQQANPEYYATRAAAGKQATNLLNSIDLNGLSGSERAEVERSNNQQDAQRGLLSAPSQTATVQNAMNFGTALQSKRNALSQAISTATSFLPSSQSGVNAFNIGSGNATNQANPAAQSSFLGTGNQPAQAANSSNSSLGNSLLGGINSTSNNLAGLTASMRDSLDRGNSVAGAANW